MCQWREETRKLGPGLHHKGLVTLKIVVWLILQMLRHFSFASRVAVILPFVYYYLRFLYYHCLGLAPYWLHGRYKNCVAADAMSSEAALEQMGRGCIGRLSLVHDVVTVRWGCCLCLSSYGLRCQQLLGLLLSDPCIWSCTGLTENWKSLVCLGYGVQHLCRSEPVIAQRPYRPGRCDPVVQVDNLEFARITA